jgi:hypothetical protein
MGENERQGTMETSKSHSSLGFQKATKYATSEIKLSFIGFI